MSKQHISLAILAALATLHFGAADLYAQNVAGAALNSIYQGNSAANFTIKREQQRILSQGIRPVGVPGVNRQNFAPRNLDSLSQKRKPFTNIDRSPAVSPYLALSNPFSTASDYYNIVKPQQDQRRINQQVARQQYAQEKRLNQVAAQGPFSITGDDELAPTGHGSGFMQLGAYLNTGSYFAPPTAPKKR